MAVNVDRESGWALGAVVISLALSVVYFWVNSGAPPPWALAARGAPADQMFVDVGDPPARPEGCRDRACMEQMAEEVRAALDVETGEEVTLVFSTFADRRPQLIDTRVDGESAPTYSLSFSLRDRLSRAAADYPLTDGTAQLDALAQGAGFAAAAPEPPGEDAVAGREVVTVSGSRRIGFFESLMAPDSLRALAVLGAMLSALVCGAGAIFLADAARRATALRFCMGSATFVGGAFTQI